MPTSPRRPTKRWDWISAAAWATVGRETKPQTRQPPKSDRVQKGMVRSTLMPKHERHQKGLRSMIPYRESDAHKSGSASVARW